MHTGWMTAEQATDALGVRRRTLYTYASRGWIRTTRDAEHARRRRYLAADVLSLRRRAQAHRGSRPAAEAALDWGPAVLASAITSIDVEGPNYRGIPALALAEQGQPFERACEILWEQAPSWPDVAATSSEVGGPMRRLRRALVRLAETPTDDASTVVTALVAALGGGGPDPRLACRMARAVGAPDHADALEAIDAALVLCADHELNASAFAARVAASAGASLADALLAALCTLSGTRHGGLSNAAEAWLSDRGPLPEAIVGHPLYADGDPRAEHLIERALDLATPARRAALSRRLHGLTRRGRPNLDAGLAALSFALNGRVGTAFSLFAVGRSSGWIAHVQEQRGQPGPLRPRARYIGP